MTDRTMIQRWDETRAHTVHASQGRFLVGKSLLGRQSWKSTSLSFIILLYSDKINVSTYTIPYPILEGNMCYILGQLLAWQND